MKALVVHLVRGVVRVTLAGAIAFGCSSEADESSAETGGEEEVLETVPGPAHRAGSGTEVWSVTNAWADRDTKAASAAGVAWGADSGLSWEEKYQKWVASIHEVARTDGQGTTIAIPTPYGKGDLEGPTLECAEVAITLRIAFSSWYHLPFYLEGWDSKLKSRMFAGHFGFVDVAGNPLAGFPRFKATYSDFEASWEKGKPWPSDAKLRELRLGDDDSVAFLQTLDGSDAGAGAYFDELFLNKRVGYFTRLTLLYFGSVNLADGRNMFHIKPEAIQPGDALIERWQRRGIGHVIPILHVDSPSEGTFSISVASGSMPRRPPLWEGPASAHRYFSLPFTGGEGKADDGTPYAKLGGGLRRFRAPYLLKKAG